MGCKSPLYVKAKAFSEDIPVPCGKCPACKQRRVNSWVFRLMQEDKISKTAFFVTLTYDTKHVPITDNGFMTLCKRDFQLFMKRLRKIQKKYEPKSKSIKYYAAGEYGETYSRPHYHAIIFNVGSIDWFSEAWSLESDSGVREALGSLDVGQVSNDSVAYVAKYIDKAKRIPMHNRDDREREFSLMSKGLGANYMTDEIVKYHKEHLDELYLTKEGGYRIAMPKYYRDKIFSETEKVRQLHIIKDKLDEEEEKLIKEVQDKGYHYLSWKAMRRNNEQVKFDNKNLLKRRKL